MYFDTEIKRSKRPLYLIAFAAVACLAIGLLSYGSKVETEEPLSKEVVDAYLTQLTNHHQYVKEQGEIIADLIEEGVENQAAITVTVAGIVAALPIIIAAAPPIIAGIKALFNSINWGQDINRKAFDPTRLQTAFEVQSDFFLGIKKRFPAAYKQMVAHTHDIRIHHFDLASALDDIRVLAQSTGDRVDQSVRQLNLRKKWLSQGKLNNPKKDGKAKGPVLDYKIWRRVIKNIVSDLTNSVTQCDTILHALAKLQTDCKKTQDNIEHQIDSMKNQLMTEVSKKGIKIDALVKKIQRTGCVNNGAEMMKAIFTLGIICAFDSTTKRQLKELKAQYTFEADLASKMVSKFDYFDDLTKMTRTLSREAVGLTKTTKTFRQAIKNTRDKLLNDFNEGEVAANLGDVDFANDFANDLYSELMKLKKTSVATVKDCNARKKRLEDALIGYRKGMPKMEQLLV